MHVRTCLCPDCHTRDAQEHDEVSERALVAISCLRAKRRQVEPAADGVVRSRRHG